MDIMILTSGLSWRNHAWWKWGIQLSPQQFFILLKILKTFDLLVAMIIAQISLDVDSAYVYVQNNGHPFSQILYVSFQTCSFSWIRLLFNKKTGHPEELEAKDFMGVSLLEFKLASAIKITTSEIIKHHAENSE